VNPVIGVTTYRETVRRGPWTQDSAILPWSYINAVSSAGGRALLLPPVADPADEVVGRLDGLVVTGGRDVSPRQYHAIAHPETTDTQPLRDTAELQLIRSALDRGLPVLGICRGMQLLNVACGGTLEQHLPDRVGHDEHRGTPGRFSTHLICVDPGSRTGRALRARAATVKSHHHQGLDRLGAGLAAVAWATNDGTVEAIERSDDAFAVGVLWHPEEEDRLGLFTALIDAARRNDTRRTDPVGTPLPLSHIPETPRR
jgi:putative glutamine amidotransferase